MREILQSLILIAEVIFKKNLKYYVWTEYTMRQQEKKGLAFQFWYFAYWRRRIRCFEILLIINLFFSRNKSINSTDWGPSSNALFARHANMILNADKTHLMQLIVLLTFKTY